MSRERRGLETTHKEQLGGELLGDWRWHNGKLEIRTREQFSKKGDGK